MINVYRASAGSGKTHKLTGEYIKLLFKQPYAYKHILAVTFTNKATDEMKQRILQELHNLSVLGRESDYLGELMELYGKGEVWIRGEARRILIAILHDYSSFSISTIDKFFQTVMRSFARELGKIATYNVELDRESVISNAIDMMFSDLDKPDNDSLLNWLIEFSLDEVDSGDSWNVRKDISDLARELFSEDFKLKNNSGNNGGCVGRDEIVILKKRVREIIESFEQSVVYVGANGLRCMDTNSVSPSDFKGGSRSPFFYFKTLSGITAGAKIEPPKGGFIALYDDISKWYTGKNIPPAIEGAYSGGLNDCVGDVLALFDRDYRLYVTAKVIMDNINALGISDDIYRRVLAYCKEKNIMLLSESTELLNKIIDGSDTPFVYEKIGTRIDNFMLDEFQDTSTLQWRNFYPLLQNSLAMGNDNLIVGDVKQSIYRWRGSDWKILNAGLFSEFREDEIAGSSLDMNWRSGKNIVEFNNEFFKFCAVTAQSVYNETGVSDTGEKLIEGIYSNFAQSVPHKSAGKEGYLEVNFVEESEDDFATDVLALLPDRVRELIDSGINQRDIAVLVRKREQGRDVAQVLINAGFDVISNDSLFVSSSVAVQKIVCILKEIENPNDESLKIYRKLSFVTSDGMVADDDEMVKFLSGLSLYDMCEAVIRHYLSPEEKGELAFLQSFLDSVLEFGNNEGRDLSRFLKWWEESGKNKTISAPEDQDAINVMTIHKSKGLGFKCVIIPFFKEKLDHIGGRLWCNIGEDVREMLPFDAPVPVVYTSALADTVFDKDYYNEKLYTFVDNLNTAYVAFTRPKDELIIYAQSPKVKKDGTYSKASVGDILYMYFEQIPEYVPVVEEWGKRIIVGESAASKLISDSTDKIVFSNVFDYEVDNVRLKTSLNTGSINEGTSIREYGIAMHYVFSLINTTDDVIVASERAFNEGISDCSASELAKMVCEKLRSVEGYGWFGGDYCVLNECDIIKPDGDVARPDRVLVKDGKAIVIDYKFGVHSPDDKLERVYKRQVRGYMSLLSEMGYESIQGYLWYVEGGEVIEC